MAHAHPSWKYLTFTSPEDASGVHVITMNKPPENRLNVELAQEVISTLRYIEKYLVSPGQAGAAIITSFSEKFWCTGVDFEEGARDPSSGAEGFFPLLATLLDYALRTVALVTGYTFRWGLSPLVGLRLSNHEHQERLLSYATSRPRSSLRRHWSPTQVKASSPGGKENAPPGSPVDSRRGSC